MSLRTLLAVFAAGLCAAAPAHAQEGTLVVPPDAPVCSGVGDVVTECTSQGDPTGDQPATVGSGQVITDPADELGEEPAPTEDFDGRPDERGEMHVLPDARQASSPSTAAEPPAGGWTSYAPISAQQQDVASSGSARAGGANAKTLPFTGVDAGPLALLGAMLLAAGLGLRRAARAGA
jgi:hypothetical protein